MTLALRYCRAKVYSRAAWTTGTAEKKTAERQSIMTFIERLYAEGADMIEIAGYKIDLDGR